MKRCVLTAEKLCNDCGACDDRCELDPGKVCDNCFRCLETDGRSYAEVALGGVMPGEPDPIAALFSLRPDLESGDFLLDSDGSWREGPAIHARTLLHMRARRSRKRNG